VATNEAIDALPGGFPPAKAAPGAPPAGRLRFRRRRMEQRGPGGAESVEEAFAELVLLREENARLKAARHQLPSFGRVVGQMRALPAPGDEAAQAADEAAEMLAEVVVMRESLLQVCEELERAMASVRARLHGLGAAWPDELHAEEDPDAP
jgi:hypothetical protein